MVLHSVQGARGLDAGMVVNFSLPRRNRKFCFQIAPKNRREAGFFKFREAGMAKHNSKLLSRANMWKPEKKKRMGAAKRTFLHAASRCSGSMSPH